MTMSALDAYGRTFPAVALGTAQVLTLGASSVSSTTFTSTTSLVWLWSDVDVWLNQGPAPLAASNNGSAKWPGGIPLAVRVAPGDKIAALPVSGSSGSLSLIEGR